MAESIITRFGSGKPVRRLEDNALITGQGRYTDDFSEKDEAHLCFLRSPHAHAEIVSIDVSPALAMPGVIAVLTGADLLADGINGIGVPPMFKRRDGQPSNIPKRPILAQQFVRFVGEPVAAIVAKSREAAKDAMEAIAIEYKERPAVVTQAAAMAPGAPRVFADLPDNFAAEMHHGDAAACDAAFAKAAHVVEINCINQRVAPSPIEPRTTRAWIDSESGRLTWRLSTQSPAPARDLLCNEVLGVPPESVRVLVSDVGGGFGMKLGASPEDCVVAYAARKLNRCVRWTAERIEEFLAATHGRDIETRASFALDKDGKVLGYRCNGLANVGAYPTTAGIFIQLMIGPFVATSIYDIKTIDLTFTVAMTNTAPLAAYRGAGRPEAIYLIERLFDAAAIALKLDPAEIRRRNLVRPEQIPYQSAMGQTYDSGDFGAILEQALKLAKWEEFGQREASTRKAGRWRGRGLASFLEWTGGGVFEERVTVSIGSNEIEIYSATQPMGQGIATSYAQLAVDTFGVPFDKIKVVFGDTDRGQGPGSAGSRSLFTAGAAIEAASHEAVSRGKILAGEALEAAVADIEYSEGAFRVAGTDKAIDLFALASSQPDRRIFVDMTTKAEGPSWPVGAHICEVEVDPETGEVEIVSYVSCNDVGRVVNPMIVRGQLDGGAVQGIGQALGEVVIYEAENGQIQTASFMDYFMPRADATPRFSHLLDESTPCRTNILGSKGVGELGTIGATPAVVNAVADALIRGGRADAARRLQMPLTPSRVWAAMNA